ncbi:hypothetical protein PHYSODRAFT_306949 [Phytophthora sojae]|uniref:RxLR effector protein n=1 Tax=Phytophthora sojae (strain P6497) TaxID=1094619 RepID=G5ABT0_PHYSP|nr:hypothetical protein PHYSODRAFT_306949 [Phytophthora sojae]EGZ06805.1 hypothetical protein PHYSODRAFT_306949 [Phytophthora sojae]|eukprot:XP_009537569.1 hypothetical protein PHYSODRAFT_306949 [Phytophthora sojae]
MRLASLLLGLTAVLLATINANASAADKTIPQGNAVQNDNQAKLFLRSDDGYKLDAEGNAEERGILTGKEVVKLPTDRLNTYITTGAKLPSGIKLTDADHLNTRLAKGDKLSSGVKWTKNAQALKKRLMTRLREWRKRSNA